MSAHVYRLYAADGTLLYIRRTEDFDTRLTLHLCTTSRLDSRVAGWETIHQRYHHHTLEPYPTLAEAKAAEIAAIRSERPLVNVHYNTGRIWRNRPVKVKTIVRDNPGATVLTALAYHLGQAMLDAGHTTQSLAEAAEVPPTQLAKCLLNGEARMAVIFGAAHVLGIKPSDLFATAEQVSA